MATTLKDQHNYFIEVQGFAPGHGQVAIATSRMMADSVVHYLMLNHNIPAYRIYLLAAISYNITLLLVARFRCCRCCRNGDRSVTGQVWEKWSDLKWHLITR